MKELGLIGASVVVIACAGCGSSTESGGGTKTVVTVIKEQTVPQRDQGSGGREDPGDGSGGGNRGGGSGKRTIPDEVGKQLQAAQDDLQAHGFYVLSNEDATGQGRFLIFDRNWKVVDQDPPGGTRASPDTHITLSAKKYTDP